MAEFVIRMADERGKVLEKAEARFSAAEIRDRYQQSGYLVYWVKPRGFISGGELRFPQRRRVTLEQFVIFNQQFLTLVRAGLPIVQALDLLTKRQRNQYFRMLLEDVRDRAKGGELISEAFEKQGAFPKIYTTTLMAGEKSGNLDEVLNRYISFQRLALTFKKKLAVSLVYPALLVSVVLVMLVFLVTYVVPQFAKLYSDLNAQLPAITLLMLEMGTHAQRYAPILAAVAGITIFLLWRWKATDRGAETIDRAT